MRGAGVGVAPPPEYSSSTPIGQIYAQLREFWLLVDALQSGDGSVSAGITFQSNKEALETALSGVLASVESFDQTYQATQAYQENLQTYAASVRGQLVDLQARCGVQASAPANAPSAPGGPTTFTGTATGLIALGASLVGGIIGFVGGKAAAAK